ncbi:MAG: phosphatidylglycerophosphatase A [Holosporales bacterium]|jgi:phosphatidylglycerophosphatase A|nr:phosphatidylglycerophosphatase A [Holosporales bacterium]
MGLIGKLNSKNFTLFIISFFGIGLISRKMPGTVGSAFATFLSIFLVKNPNTLLLLLIAFFIAGVILCDYFVVKMEFAQNKDPGYIVIDEVCGILLGTYFLQIFGYASAFSLITNFAIFRFFDILKPPPIKNIENAMKNNQKTIALGIMLDDILASLFATVSQILILKIINLLYNP